MRHARMRDARFTSVETGALEWINHVLRHEWRAVIGARVDAQAGATLASVLADAPAMTAGVVRDAEVDACTLGVVPPDLNLYVSSFNPIAEYLQFEFDLDWRTVSSHIVIGAIKPTMFVPAVRIPIHVTDFAISGRLLVGFRLARRPPGVSGRIGRLARRGARRRPCRGATDGAPVSDLPGVHEFIKAKIASVFASNYVEPRRYYHDVEGPWLRSAGAGARTQPGPSGRSSSDVAGARRLRPVDVDGQRKTSANAYVELTYAGVTRTTATRLKTLNPDWNVRVAFPPCDDEDADEGRRGRGGGGARPPPEGEFGSPPDHHRRGADRVAAGALKTSASSSAEKGSGGGLGLGRRSTAASRAGDGLQSPWGSRGAWLGVVRCRSTSRGSAERGARRARRNRKPSQTPEGRSGWSPSSCLFAARATGSSGSRFGGGAAARRRKVDAEKEKEKAAFFERDGLSVDDAGRTSPGGRVVGGGARVARAAAGTRLADALVDVWGDDLLDDDGNRVGGGSDDTRTTSSTTRDGSRRRCDRPSREPPRAAERLPRRRGASSSPRRLPAAGGDRSPAAGMARAPSPSAATRRRHVGGGGEHASCGGWRSVAARRRREHAAATKALKARFRGAREDARRGARAPGRELRRALIEGAAFVVPHEA